MDLQNDHNVYILGAGFCRDAGLPLLPDFLTRMRDCHPWLEQQARDGEAKAVKAVLEFRLEAASAAYWTNLDLENIEELFSLASASLGNLSSQIQIAIAATLDYCASVHPTSTGHLNIGNLRRAGHLQWVPLPEVGQQYAVVGRYEHHVAKLLGLFHDGAVKGRNTFITLNYDTTLEDALSKMGIRFGYCFSRPSVTYHDSAKAHKDDTEITILKLHGSINWAKQPGRKRWGFTVFGNYSDLKGDSLVPELVPPTWKKIFPNHIADLWNSAVRKLTTATRIIILGFSMPPTDLHFKYLLAAGLQGNVSLREVMFVNPAADQIKARAHTLLRQQYIDAKRIEFDSTRLEDFVNDEGKLWRIGRPIDKGAHVQFI